MHGHERYEASVARFWQIVAGALVGLLGNPFAVLGAGLLVMVLSGEAAPKGSAVVGAAFVREAHLSDARTPSSG